MRIASDFLTEETLTRRGLGATRAGWYRPRLSFHCEVMVGDPNPDILRSMVINCGAG